MDTEQIQLKIELTNWKTRLRNSFWRKKKKKNFKAKKYGG